MWAPNIPLCGHMKSAGPAACVFGYGACLQWFTKYTQDNSEGINIPQRLWGPFSVIFSLKIYSANPSTSKTSTGGVNGKFGKKLSYIECLYHKALLYSTENYFQYPSINHNGREYGKEYRYVYIYLEYGRNSHDIVHPPTSIKYIFIKKWTPRSS